MSEIWRHLEVDFRRYGWLAAAALVAEYFAPFWGQGLLVLLVVPLMVMNHKASGSRAWWLVRPLNRNRLWFAKFLEVLLLCFGAVVVMSVEPVLQGIHPVFVAWCRLELLPPLVAACGVTAIVASLSPDLRRYFLVLPAVLVAAACLAALWVQLADFVAVRNPGAAMLRWFPTEPRDEYGAWFLAALLSAAGLFVAIWTHLRKRRPGATIAFAAMAIVAPLYFGNVVSLEPLYVGFLKLQGQPVSYDEFRPIAGHITVQETKLVAEEKRSPDGRLTGWLVRIPFEIHLDEELEADQLFETHVVFQFSSVDRSNPIKGQAGQSPFGRWYFNHFPALLHAAGVEPAGPVDPGREAWARFDLPDGARIEDWTDLPLSLTRPFKAFGEIKRAHFVGALEFSEGSRLIDRGDLHRIFRTRTREGKNGLALTGKTLLEPHAFFNPAKQWNGGDGRVNFVLWDSRKSEAHFAERGIKLETLPGGDFRFESGFPVLRDRRFAAARLEDLKLLVIREVSIERNTIPIKPATFTIRLLDEPGGQ